MPGAAHLAFTASSSPRVWGSTVPWTWLKPSRPLLAQGEVPPPGPVGVRKVAVLVEGGGQPVRSCPQVLGPQPAGQLGQLRLGGLTGGKVHEAGQLGEEPADDRHLLGADLPALLGGGGVGQHRRQHLTGQRHPRPQILGLTHPPIRLAAEIRNIVDNAAATEVSPSSSTGISATAAVVRCVIAGSCRTNVSHS
jgi:hypothetical protein